MKEQNSSTNIPRPSSQKTSGTAGKSVPHLFTALNTNQGQELERARRTIAGDWLLHEGLSNWLHICGLPQQAKQA